MGKLDDRSTLGVFIGYTEGSKAYHILDLGTQCVRTTRNIVFNEWRGWVLDKALDDGSTLTYDNFTIEYVHFKGGWGYAVLFHRACLSQSPSLHRPQRHALQP
jgi:hypothetical protein